jgi:hypothetical protein
MVSWFPAPFLPSPPGPLTFSMRCDGECVILLSCVGGVLGVALLVLGLRTRVQYWWRLQRARRHVKQVLTVPEPYKAMPCSISRLPKIWEVDCVQGHAGVDAWGPGDLPFLDENSHHRMFFLQVSLDPFASMDTWVQPSSYRPSDYWGPFSIHNIRVERGTMESSEGHYHACLSFVKHHGDVQFLFRVLVYGVHGRVQGHGWWAMLGQTWARGQVRILEEDLP